MLSPTLVQEMKVKRAIRGVPPDDFKRLDELFDLNGVADPTVGLALYDRAVDLGGDVFTGGSRSRSGTGHRLRQAGSLCPIPAGPAAAPGR